MKFIFYIFTILLLTIEVSGQTENQSVHVIHYKRDVSLHNSKLVKKIRIKKIFVKRTYKELVSQIADSCKFYGGDCAEIIFYDGSGFFEHRTPHLIANLYVLDKEKRDEIIPEIERVNAGINAQLKRKKKLLQYISGVEQIDFDRENRRYARKQIQHSVKKSFFEAAVGGGVDYLFLMFNFNVAAELYLISGNSIKLSLNNKSGAQGGIAPTPIIYTYPSIKYHQKIIANRWITVSFGREYHKFYGEIDKQWVTREIDYRIDIGVRVYESSRKSFEIYVPIRVDDEVPVFLTGPSINYYYSF